MKVWLFLMFCYLSASSQEVIITEIFADPTPVRGLPPREFLEIYNTTSQAISLKGYTLKNSKSTVSFPDSTILPHEYVIVCKDSYVNEFRHFGKTIGLTTFSLNNNGSNIILLDDHNKELHQVAYSASWYLPTRSEGYSLEMIDPDFYCLGKENWTSTSNELGGTPGQQNSVYGKKIDSQIPILLESSKLQQTILLVFNKVLSGNFANDINNFEIIKGDASILNVSFFNEERTSILLELDSEDDEELKIQVYNLEDCTGQMGKDFSITLLNLTEPLPGEIQISEILFNPKTGGQDFVELVNKSNKKFNLKNWMFNSLSGKGIANKSVLISSFDRIIQPDEYLAFTTNKRFLEENYYTGNIIELAALPALNNDAGTIMLLQPDSVIFDQFTYTENMHNSLINNRKGVSLEKTSFLEHQNKWASASSDAGYATPGLPNSQRENDYLEKSFFCEPLVFNPSSEKPLTYLTYQLSEPADYASIKIVDKSGQIVKSLGKNLLMGTSGKIEWNGTDSNGNILPPGYYVFIIDLFNSINHQKFYAKTVLGAY